MATNPVSTTNMWPNYAKGNVSNKNGNGQELGKDQFLSILITHAPSGSTSADAGPGIYCPNGPVYFPGRLMNINTQLTAMSQSLGSASSLIGKQISWLLKPEDDSEAVMKSGIVDSIIVREGVHYAKVGDSEVSLDQIMKIENAVTEDDPEALNPSLTDPATNNPDPSVPETANPGPSDTEAGDFGQGVDEPEGTAP